MLSALSNILACSAVGWEPDLELRQNSTCSWSHIKMMWLCGVGDPDPAGSGPFKVGFFIGSSFLEVGSVSCQKIGQDQSKLRFHSINKMSSRKYC
jgi:hypothetical protein